MSENFDWSEVTRVFYDWNDVDNAAVISKGDIIFAGDSEGGMKVKVIGYSLLNDSILINFERLPDSEWIEVE